MFSTFRQVFLESVFSTDVSDSLEADEPGPRGVGESPPVMSEIDGLGKTHVFACSCRHRT